MKNIHTGMCNSQNLILMPNIHQFNIDGYTVISNNWESNKRGIIFYVANELEFSVEEINVTYEESLLLKIGEQHGEGLYICHIP